ncbi:MAG: hypothetical protein CMG04_09175 [Candidatus Marinimicrobia bacterium]|nr:hypothetical protein [Candidatus Neomarinimicrobiota bacterium]|tara:strand:- start:1456 stop:2913 length:1458 start_codon:yes stop_codon:yes gene_type:complete
MINTLYVGADYKSIPQLNGTQVNVEYVQNGMIAIGAVQAGDYDCIIIEDTLPLMSVSRLVDEFVSMESKVPVISIVRSKERKSNFLDDFGHGLYGWFEPDMGDSEELVSLIESAKNFHNFIKNTDRKDKRYLTPVGYKNLVGISSNMLSIYRLMIQIRRKDVTTLLTGESGTGKNVAAKTLHLTGIRRDKAVISVNCPAIPSELLESELFGHEKGSFTGAIGKKDGKFLAANGGTIFLDEIGDMSPTLQAKILRVLESGEIERVGGTETIKVNVRVISATNQKLEKKIREGVFREDLYHRINVFPISLPPLRVRKEDIPATAMAILKKHVKKYNSISRFICYEGIKVLKSYSWPGNVREMENLLERVVLLCENKIITDKDILPLLPKNNDDEQIKVSEKEPASSSTIKTEQEIVKNNLNDSNLVNNNLNNDKDNPIITLKELEHSAIIEGLKRTKWNLSLTAQQLGISRMTLYRKIDQHGLKKDG